MMHGVSVDYVVFNWEELMVKLFHERVLEYVVGELRAVLWESVVFVHKSNLEDWHNYLLTEFVNMLT